MRVQNAGPNASTTVNGHTNRIKSLISRRNAAQQDRNASAEAESAAKHCEREAAAQRIAEELIRDEEAEKERVQKKKAKKSKAIAKGGSPKELQCSPAVPAPAPAPAPAPRVHAAPAKLAEVVAENGGSFAGDGWVAPKARRGARAAGERPVPRDSGARMLVEWKTRPCPSEEEHNWTLCQHFHAGGVDRRRNPFAECYLPEQSANKVEELYHPLRFRTQLCARRRACAFRDPYVCSFAHSEQDLRAMAEAEYLALFAGSAAAASMRPPARLGDFLGPQALAAPVEEGADTPSPTYGWSVERLPAAPRAAEPLFVALTAFQDYVVAHSGRMWRRIEDVAGLYLCRVQRHQRARDEPAGLLVFGEWAEADMVSDSVREILRSPPEEIVSCDKESFSERVVAHIQEQLALRGNGLFGSSVGEGVSVEADADSGTVAVRALRSRSKPNAGGEVLSQIRFWLQQEGLDDFVECCICCDRINRDQGVSCPGGHYVCSRGSDEESCMAGLITSQIASIKSQDDQLLCPVCKAGISEQRVATRVSAAAWGAVQGAILEARVERRYAELQSEFDNRLNKKVKELIDKFGRGDVSELISQQGAAGAAEARNKALNLACPHCLTVYAEFDGCMALNCASCSKDFCGYCHKAVANSRGCHEHVRECDMNLTTNGSYYADALVIKEAQRRYRIKRLKLFLRSGEYKKDVQNAIIFKLSADLKDLGIDPAALFDVGNLQDDEAAR